MDPMSMVVLERSSVGGRPFFALDRTWNSTRRKHVRGEEEEEKESVEKGKRERKNPAGAGNRERRLSYVEMPSACSPIGV